MTITITINTDNAVFEDDPEHEVGRILEGYAEDLVRGDTTLRPRRLYDANGNTVGAITITEDTD